MPLRILYKNTVLGVYDYDYDYDSSMSIIKVYATLLGNGDCEW